MTKGVFLVGVGGQGIILAADVLARTLLEAGFDVKLSEVHGMSQRGGSVYTSVKFGDKVHSPLVERGEADYLVAFEQMEAARWISHLRPGGKVITSDEKIYPLSVLLGIDEYPNDLLGALEEYGVEINIVSAIELAEKAGNRRAANVALLGALAQELPVDVETWRSVIKERVPVKTIEINLKAFDLGYECAVVR